MLSGIDHKVKWTGALYADEMKKSRKVNHWRDRSPD
jgi:hypothetical protein